MSGTAIDARNVSKRFRLYHEKRTSVYEAVAGYFSRRRHYETILALDDVSFRVNQGEMFGIVGHNGSGKTTLLRILSNIYRPDSGSVDISGKIIPVLGLGLGFHPELTATANIVQGATLLGIPKPEIDRGIDDVIRFAELERFADTKLKNLSSGMQMRLAFSTAVQVDPDVLVLDEVFAVGDLDFQKKCFDAIMDFRRRGRSVVLVSHSMRPILDHCDRAMLLDGGRVGAIGKPADVVSSYTSGS